MTQSVAPTHSHMYKVERVLPIAVDAVNDPPKVVTPHHHVIKFGAFSIWSRYLPTQAGLSVTKSNLTVGISTDTNSGQIVFHGVGTENVTFQVNDAFHGRLVMPLFALMPCLEDLRARYVGPMVAWAVGLDWSVSRRHHKRTTTNTAQAGTLSCPSKYEVNLRGKQWVLSLPPADRFGKKKVRKFTPTTCQTC